MGAGTKVEVALALRSGLRRSVQTEPVKGSWEVSGWSVGGWGCCFQYLIDRLIDWGSDTSTNRIDFWSRGGGAGASAVFQLESAPRSLAQTAALPSSITGLGSTVRARLNVCRKLLGPFEHLNATQDFELNALVLPCLSVPWIDARPCGAAGGARADPRGRPRITAACLGRRRRPARPLRLATAGETPSAPRRRCAKRRARVEPPRVLVARL